MKGPWKFATVAAGVVLVSALLAPPLHAVLPYPFPRVFRRLLMINAIIAAAVFVRLRRETLVRYGMAWKPDSVCHLGAGFLAGIGGLAAFALLSVATGHAELAIRQVPALYWAERIAGGVLTGVLIGVLEEILFRGFVFTSVRDSMTRGRALPAMAVTSLLYAVLHVLQIGQPTISANPGFADGLKLALAPLRSLADGTAAWPSFVGLFLFGTILNLALVRTGSLYPSIGLHAGCVSFLRIMGLFFRFDPSNTWLWSTKRVYDGAMGWVFLLLIGGLLIARLKRTGGNT